MTPIQKTAKTDAQAVERPLQDLLKMMHRENIHLKSSHLHTTISNTSKTRENTISPPPRVQSNADLLQRYIPGPGSYTQTFLPYLKFTHRLRMEKVILL
jgi:hypothetical protein